MRSPFNRVDPQTSERDAENNQALVMERFERCTFCNSKLIFSHDLNLSYLQVIETGRCPGCGVSMVPRKYTLQ